ncbi:MAG: nitroreductase family protein [Christensenellales bacterium]|jgi:nitroreductase
MNEVLRAIEGRRSIRGYGPGQMSKDELQLLLKAALESPSARNLQPWHFSVVQNKTLLDEIEAEVCEKTSREAGSIFFGAPTVIFISADETSMYGGIDSGIAVQTLSLAAHSLGLGSVILGMPRAAFEGENADRFEKALKFPKGYKFRIALAVGHPAVTKDAHEIGENKIDIIQ